MEADLPHLKSLENHLFCWYAYIMKYTINHLSLIGWQKTGWEFAWYMKYIIYALWWNIYCLKNRVCTIYQVFLSMHFDEIYRVVFWLVRPNFSAKNKNVVQPIRIFSSSRISWNRISDWLPIVFHFGTENWEEQ